MHDHVHKSTDAQQAGYDYAHGKKLDAADVYFTEVESDDGLKRAVDDSTEAN